MSTLNVEHLFEQADRLLSPLQPGPPRQVDLRRAISAAYYGLFHFVMGAAAAEFVGAAHQQSARYRLVYRRIDHAVLRAVCQEVAKRPSATRFTGYLPAAGFGDDMRRFSLSVIELQHKRHRADYDPGPRFETADARVAVDTAREPVAAFRRASSDERKLILTLFFSPPRG